MGLQHLISYLTLRGTPKVQGEPVTEETRERGRLSRLRDWYHYNVSVRGLPDKDDPRYIDPEEQGD